MEAITVQIGTNAKLIIELPDKVKARIQDLESSLITLRTDYRELLDSKLELESKYGDLKEENSNLKTELEFKFISLGAENLNLENENSNLKAKNKELEANVDESMMQIKELMTRNKRLEEELKAKNKEFEALCDRTIKANDVFLKAIDYRNKEIDELKAKLKSEIERSDSLRIENQEILEEFSDAVEEAVITRDLKINDLEDEVEDLANQVDKLEDELNEANSIIDVLENDEYIEIDEYREKKEKYKIKLDELEEENSELKLRIQELEAKNEELEDDVNELEEENSKLKQIRANEAEALANNDKLAEQYLELEASYLYLRRQIEDALRVSGK